MGRLKDLPISPVGLGGGPFGNMFSPLDDATARATVDAAWDAGIRLFDTAPLYGHGRSEHRVGAALRDRPRDEFVLSTKVGRLLEPGPGPDEPTIFVDLPDLHPVYDYSADAVRRSVAESLDRLGLDRIDVVFVHDPDDHEDEAIEGAFPALVRLRDEGAVRAIGSGMNQAEMLARFVDRVDLDCVLMAGRYTLLEQGARETLLDRCVDHGVDVVAGGVFNSGLLADPGRRGVTYEYWPAHERDVARAERLAGVCARHDVPLAAAALQFPAAHPAVAAVVVGARSPAEIRDDVALAAVPIPPALWADLQAEGLIDRDAPVPA